VALATSVSRIIIRAKKLRTWDIGYKKRIHSLLIIFIVSYRSYKYLIACTFYLILLSYFLIVLFKCLIKNPFRAIYRSPFNSSYLIGKIFGRIFSGGIFLEGFFWRNFSRGIFLEKFFELIFI
jgi:hypothetical protein